MTTIRGIARELWPIVAIALVFVALVCAGWIDIPPAVGR